MHTSTNIYGISYYMLYAAVNYINWNTADIILYRLLLKPNQPILNIYLMEVILYYFRNTVVGVIVTKKKSSCRFFSMCFFICRIPILQRYQLELFHITFPERWIFHRMDHIVPSLANIRGELIITPHFVCWQKTTLATQVHR